MKREIEDIKREALQHEEVRDPEADREYSTGFMHQLQVVGVRTLTAFYRNPDYGKSAPSAFFRLQAMKLMSYVRLHQTL
jgi:hypothetical protein